MIGFDLDDTVMETITILNEEFIKNYSFDINIDRSFTIKIPGVSSQEIGEFINAVLLKRTMEIVPHKNADAYMEWFYDKFKRPICFITARPAPLHDITIKWVQRYIPVPFKVYFAGSNSKKDLIKKVGLTEFVDDRVRTAFSMAPNLKTFFIMNHPWNMNRELPENAVRINDFNELKESLI